MKDTKKKFIGAALAVSSVAGIVAPSVTAMANVIEDENGATADELRKVINEYSVKLEQNPIFANFHRVLYAAERLAQYDANEAATVKASIAAYGEKVFTKEVMSVVDKMDGFAQSKSMESYDELVNKIVPAMESKENAEYLMGRLNVWGQAIVFQADPNYSKATDAIIKVKELREAGKLEDAKAQVKVAEEAIKAIKTYDVNGAYLKAQLKIEADAVETAIENQDLHVTSVVAKNAKEIEVKFNKAVREDLAEDVSSNKYYSIVRGNSDAAADKLDLKDAELQDDNKTVIITLDTVLNDEENAKYVVTVKDIETENDEKIEEYSELVTLFDNVKPEVTGIEYRDADTVRVNFSEPMNATKSQIKSALKIKLDGSNVSIHEDAITKIDEDGMYFELSKSKANLEEDKNYSIELTGLVDYAVNSLEKYTGTINFKEDSVDPQVEKIEVLSQHSFKVTFDEKVNFKADNVKVKEGKTEKTGIKVRDAEKDSDDVDNKTYIVEFTGDVDDSNAIIVINGFTDYANNDGEYFEKEFKFEKSHPVLESKTPEYETINDKKCAIFTFDRDIKFVDGGDIQGKYVDEDGVTKYSDFKMHIKDTTNYKDLEHNEVAINLDEANLENEVYTFDIQKGFIKDDFDQEIEKVEDLSFEKTENNNETIEVKENGVEVKKDGDDEVVIVTFNKDLSKESITSGKDVSKYTVDGVQAFEKAEFTEKNQLKLTLKDDTIDKSETKTFAIKNVKNVKNYSEKHDFIDNTKPEINKAELLSYDTIKLNMSERVKFTEDKIEDVIVKVDGNEVEYKVEGNKTDVLTLKLTKAVKSEDKEKITIEVKENNDITDGAKNKAKEVTKTVEVNFNQALITAMDKVKIAEVNKDTTSVEEAQKAINTLADGIEKTNLQNRLDVVKAQIAKVEKEATDLVVKAEGSKSQIDVEAAEDKVTALKDGDTKTGLQVRLNYVKTEIAALTAVEKAENEQVASVRSGLKIEAQKLVNALKDGQFKDGLIVRLNAIL